MRDIWEVIRRGWNDTLDALEAGVMDRRRLTGVC